MDVASLWRYPVKSMRGEQLTELELGPDGVVGDRSYGVLDVTSGTVVSAKRDGRLFEAAARYEGDQLLVSVPGAEDMQPGGTLDRELSRWLGRPARLVGAATHGTATFEANQDAEDETTGTVQWEGLPGSFVDESHLLLLTTGELYQLTAERPDLQWDVRRFRPNVVLSAGATALAAPGRRARLGAAEVELQYACTRCVMTSRAQPGGLQRQLDVLRHVVGAHDNEVGYRARVVSGGAVRTGDTLDPGLGHVEA